MLPKEGMGKGLLPPLQQAELGKGTQELRSLGTTLEPNSSRSVRQEIAMQGNTSRAFHREKVGWKMMLVLYFLPHLALQNVTTKHLLALSSAEAAPAISQ